MTDVVAELRRRAADVMVDRPGFRQPNEYEEGAIRDAYLDAAKLVESDPLYKAAPELRDTLQFALDHAPLEDYNVNGEFERRAKAVLATLPKEVPT